MADWGADWLPQTSGTTNDLSSVACVNASRCWAVGAGGTILRTTDGGALWTPQLSGTGNWLYSVDFVDAYRGWAVGFGGTILRTTDGGEGWTPQDSGTTAVLYSVDFTDASNGWVVGEGGTILRTTDGGAHWTPWISPTTMALNSVTFTDPSYGWAVGNEGTILRLCKPDPYVRTPVAPSRVSHTRYYTVWGYLEPRHASGTYPVRVYKERYVSGAWKSCGYESARVSNYSSFSRYSHAIRLPYHGKWRLRAYAPADAAHAAAWSSGYDYVTVY
jgi:hypothetical protein